MSILIFSRLFFFYLSIRWGRYKAPLIVRYISCAALLRRTVAPHLSLAIWASCFLRRTMPQIQNPYAAPMPQCAPHLI